MRTATARRFVRGALSGALAVVPMTAEFWLARGLALVDEVPPHKATRSIYPRLPEPALTLASAAAHVLVGAAAGAAYATVVPPRLLGAGSGMAAGIAVWLSGYELVMPLVTEMQPAHRDRRDRAASILVAHLTFGAAMGWTARYVIARHPRSR